MRKLFSMIALAIVPAAFAQWEYRDSNRIGIIGGINQFSLNSSNFDAKPQLGWNAGLSMRGNFYNDFDMVYAIQFSENKFSVATTNPVNTLRKDVEFKLPSAQISLMLSYKIVEHHLSIEFGPMVQIGDKFKIDDDANTNNIIDGTTFKAGDIRKISRFNFYPVAGVTFGIKHLRANVQYAYGLTNMLGNLNDASLYPGVKFKGNAGILSGNLIIYL